ncbi:methylthioribulose 1-phosphate dehydratase [Kitasatospora viridis]|uniref:Methylthioribulose-1-phosphate dehydratase n=1 Tax=Kitasatospora viridis TaxID=281105 RepID=A0A561UCT3_9ACTN|nr:methylthioribulose 1-phosphate dehydratase [Kitasatospora viridis]TWF97155.1 methylthioribulose-1-phosphate dehydratase [Kitasatospora viridis]
MTTATFAQRGAELAEFSGRLYERGWLPGTSGNLSVRLPGAGGRALITASGFAKGELTGADTVVVDIATDEVAEPTALRASAETSIHTAIYRTTGAEAVIHVHSPYATALACRIAPSDRPQRLRLERFELLKGLGLADPSAIELPVLPNWPDVARIAADTADHLTRTPQAPPALLIADHGITAWGRNLAQARNRLECLEAICQVLTVNGGAVPVLTTGTSS